MTSVTVSRSTSLEKWYWRALSNLVSELGQQFSDTKVFVERETRGCRVIVYSEFCGWLSIFFRGGRSDLRQGVILDAPKFFDQGHCEISESCENFVVGAGNRERFGPKVFQHLRHVVLPHDGVENSNPRFPYVYQCNGVLHATDGYRLHSMDTSNVFLWPFGAVNRSVFNYFFGAWSAMRSFVDVACAKKDLCLESGEVRGFLPFIPYTIYKHSLERLLRKELVVRKENNEFFAWADTAEFRKDVVSLVTGCDVGYYPIVTFRTDSSGFCADFSYYDDKRLRLVGERHYDTVGTLPGGLTRLDAKYLLHALRMSDSVRCYYNEGLMEQGVLLISAPMRSAVLMPWLLREE